MTPGRDVVRGVWGAALLARFDRSGMAVFDISADGFWRSFVAVAVTVPLYVLMLMMPAVGGAEGGAIIVDIGAMVVVWMTVLGAMLVLTRLVGAAENYAAFVIAYNWSNVIVAAIMLTAGAIGSAFPGTSVEPAILLTAALYVIAYNWFVIRESLGTDATVAILLLLATMVVELLVDYGIGALSGAGPASGA